MTLKRFVVLFAIAATTSLAADISTRDGRIYRNAEVTGVDRDGIRVKHSTGVAKIPFEELPEALQKQYHYDAVKVAAYRKQVEDAQKAAAAKAAAAEQQRQREVQQAAQAAEEQRRVEEAAAQRAAEEQRRIEQKRMAEEARQKQLQEIGRFSAIVVGCAIGLLLYFLPSIVGRQKANAKAIFVFNLFLGWTFLGWVCALVWACTKDSAMETLARERMARGDARYLE